MSIILVDCEADGLCPGAGELIESGAVELRSMKEFHGKVFTDGFALTFEAFSRWLADFAPPLTFVADNLAYDWQWINHGFATTIGKNPFGHSGRNIKDFYAGIMLSFWNTQEWKRLRTVPHDHNPVNDAKGNAIALKAIIEIGNKKLTGGR